MVCVEHVKSEERSSKKRIPDIGKSALITGASSGLGRELTILFSQTGHIILSGRNEAALEVTKLACINPANTTIVLGSLCDTETQAQLAAFSDLYEIHYLICCAAEHWIGPLERMPREQISDIIDSNLTATIKLVHAIYPAMLRRLDGSIIIINSVSGRNIAVNEDVYSASKHGLAGFSKAFRLEARKNNIRVMDVFLGGMQTPMAAGRDDKHLLISPHEAARVIYKIAANPLDTLQVEEISLGRTKF